LIKKKGKKWINFPHLFVNFTILAIPIRERPLKLLPHTEQTFEKGDLPPSQNLPHLISGYCFQIQPPALHTKELNPFFS